MQPRRGANESSTTPTTPLILSVPVYRLFSSLLSVWVYCLFIHPHHHCLHFSLFLSLSPFSVLLALSCLLTLSQAMHPSNVCVHVCAHTHTRVSTHTDRHAHAHTYTHAHTRTHTHTYTHKHESKGERDRERERESSRVMFFSVLGVWRASALGVKQY